MTSNETRLTEALERSVKAGESLVVSATKLATSRDYWKQLAGAWRVAAIVNSSLLLVLSVLVIIAQLWR